MTHDIEITSLIQAYVALSKGMRFGAKRDFWDLDEPLPVLVPEEAAAPLIGWAAIDSYWAETAKSILSLESTCWGIVVNQLHPDLAMAAFHLRWRATIPDGLLAGKLAAHVRVNAVLRRKINTWKFHSYVESHVDGVVYAREMYRRAERSPNV